MYKIEAAARLLNVGAGDPSQHTRACDFAISSLISVISARAYEISPSVRPLGHMQLLGARAHNFLLFRAAIARVVALLRS